MRRCRLVCVTASCGVGVKLTTLAASTSWKSVMDPVEPTQPKASCFGTPLGVVHEDG